MDFSRVKNEDLYQMCLRGDDSAWTYVYRYALAIARSPRWKLRDSPEDMAQSIVCHILTKGLDQVRAPKAFRGFIRRLAVNFILDHLKKKGLSYQSLSGEGPDGEDWEYEPASENPGPEDLFFGSEFFQLLDRATSSLPKKCRDTLKGYRDYKLGEFDSYKSLAKHFGLSIGTLSSQIKRCLDRLLGVKEIKAWLEG